MVSQSQVVYTRSGTNLALGPIGSSAFDQSIDPLLQRLFVRHLAREADRYPAYGLSYMLEMPPYEAQRQAGDGGLSRTAPRWSRRDYMAQREKAALAGQVYNPILGFATVNNVGAGRKYPYDPFYGGFSPRFSVAWNPKFSDGILGKLLGQQQDRHSRRLWPHLRPAERRQPRCWCRCCLRASCRRFPAPASAGREAAWAATASTRARPSASDRTA